MVKKLGEMLVESALITEEQLQDALTEGKAQKLRLGVVLIKKGYVTDVDIAQTLSYQLKIPYVDLSETPIDPEAVKRVDEKLAKKYHLFPISIDKKAIRIAMSDPLDLHAIDDVRFSAGMEVLPSAAALNGIITAINRHYHTNEPMEELITDINKAHNLEVVAEIDTERDISENVRKSNAPPIIKMVDSIITHSFENRASDIHIEPHGKGVRLRLRIDGIMKETMQFPKWVMGPMVSRIKIMAKLDIAERRVSQDGKIKVRLGDKSADIRVSTLPTQYGETVVMRILDPNATQLTLNSVGLVKEDVARIKDIIERPQGIVLVTGPTGSGKTSMLYAMMTHIKNDKINIITIEDPIEYEMKDVNQVAINDKAGLTFAYTLRSVLRQDPDVILVGEMRDAETATIAHQASITGHLVFSTLHTHDAVSSIIRLRNMGVPTYMIASALNGIVNQRLVRLICNDCKEEYQPTPEALKRIGIHNSSRKLFRGAGCKSCNGSGYKGRTGIYEIMKVTGRIKALITADAPEQELLKAAAEGGMVPLHMDGFKKVVAGLTTIDELARVIYVSKDENDANLSFETAEEKIEEGGICPSCLSSISVESEKCPHCRVTILKKCPGCSKERSPRWVVCPFCASRYEEYNAGNMLY